MKKKIIVLLLSLVISFSAISVTGETVIFTNSGKNITEVNHDDPELPPLPGLMNTDYPALEITTTAHTVQIPTKVLGTSSDDIITELIQQLDEDLYLDYLEGLVACGPRVTGTQECDNAADYIYNEFIKMGIETRYQEWEINNLKGKNIEATIHGTDTSSNEIYIICGHYDTVYDSPGADDDGSGTVLALSAAKIMSTYGFNHTIKFVAFSGEEEGLYGSYFYVLEALDNDYEIRAVLNADMIGFALTQADAGNLKVYENTPSHWITEFTSDVSDQYKDILNLKVNPSGSSSGSDHYHFWQAGYNAIFYAEDNFNDFYHSSRDTIENMNIPYAVRTSKLIIATLAELSEIYVKNPPLKPTTPQGPISGKIEVEYLYTTSTIDPEGDQVYYLWDWSDGNNSGWLGPYNSGVTCEAKYTWDVKGNYNIKVKAKDSYGAESDWSDSLTVTMPYSYNKPIPQFLELLFQRFPNTFPLL